MSSLGTFRLKELYDHLRSYPENDIDSRYEIERPEQELIAKFLPQRCCVLEIGGLSGTTSIIINKILKDPMKHIVIDPSIESLINLNEVKKRYDCKFQIAYGFLGKDREKHEQICEDCRFAKMWNLSELETLVDGQKFDVLVIDCEGAFYNILNDMPEILESVKLIIIEMDGSHGQSEEIRKIFFDYSFVLVESHVHPYFNKGMHEDPLFSTLQTVDDLGKLFPSLVGFHQVFVKN